MYYVTQDFHKSGDVYVVYEGNSFTEAKDIAFTDFYYDKSRHDRQFTLYYELQIFDTVESYKNGEEPSDIMVIAADILEIVEEWL